MNKNANRIIILAVVLVVAGAAFAGYMQSQSKNAAPQAQSVPGMPPAGAQQNVPGMPPPGVTDSAQGDPNAGESAPEVKVSEINPDEYDQGVQPNDAKPLPAEIAGVPRATYQSGAAAVAEINKLHGISVPVSSGQFASYEKGEEKIVVWVSESKSNEDARALMKAMLAKMETPKYYSVPVPLAVKGRIYFQSMSSDMQNYFYLRGNRVFWVALKVQSDKVMTALKFIVSGA